MTFDELIKKHEALVSKAFQEAISQIKSNIILDVVTDRLARGDVQGAIQALQVEPEAFSALERVLQDAFADGGEALIQELPSVRVPDGPAVVWQFGIRNLGAETLLREQSSNLIKQIVEDQKVSIRKTVERGLAMGQNPKTTALDIVGRVNKISGQREGGIIGLTTQQEQWQRSYEADLRSSDPKRLREALRRGLRDKRFDRSILKAIRTGEPIPSATIKKMVAQYRNKSLKYRADMIGRNETMAALSNARENAIQQQIDSGKISGSHVFKVWDDVGDSRTRHTHRAMNGQSVIFDQAFTSPSGARIRYPHDPDAPSSERVACRCRLHYEIDFIAAGYEKRRKRISA